MTPAKLAATLECAVRTVHRDLDELRGAGVPISFDDEAGGYVIRKDFFLRPVDFTLEEAMALILLGREVGQTEQIPHATEAGRAVEKLLAVVPSAIREMTDELLPRMSIALGRTANEPTADVYTQFRQAITDKRALQCEYESASRQPSRDSGKFRFDPYALYFGQRAWYVIGLHHGRGEVRTLKLLRFLDCQTLDKPYLIPDEFSLDTHFKNAWRMMPSGTMHDIHLHFDPVMAETVADTHWHDSQEVDWNDDHSIDVHFRVDGLEEIIWWVLGYGPHCRVVGPPILAVRIAELHKRAAEQYK